MVPILLRAATLRGGSVDVLIEGGRISALAPGLSLPSGGQGEVIEAGAALLAPAFLELQLNGAFGHDLVDDPESVWEIARRLPRHGVGSFLPTIISSAPEAATAMIAVLERGAPEGFIGARPLGIHMEGPCLAAARRGAHEERFLVPPSSRPEAALHPLVKMVTLAPELEGAAELIVELSERGVVVAAGHSNADSQRLAQAKALGLRAGTHLFNAMSGLHHRQPGLAAALLDDDALFAGIIADGVHVDPLMLRLAWKMKGPHHLYLVSDAVAAAGCEPGSHRLAGQEVLVDETSVRLMDGTLAGSSALLDRCLREMMKATGVKLTELLPLVTTTPAGLLGLDLRLRPGARADLVLLSPEAEPLVTILDGRIAYRA